MMRLHLHSACILHSLSMFTLSFCPAHTPMSLQCLRHSLTSTVQHVAYTQGIWGWPPVCSLCVGFLQAKQLSCLQHSYCDSLLTVNRSDYRPRPHTTTSLQSQACIPCACLGPFYCLFFFLLLQVYLLPRLPVKDTAALCLTSWPAVKIVKLLRSVGPQISKSYCCRQLTAGHFSSSGP